MTAAQHRPARLASGAIRSMRRATLPHPHTLRVGFDSPVLGAASRAIFTIGGGFFHVATREAVQHGPFNGGPCGEAARPAGPNPVCQPRTVCHPHLTARAAGSKPVLLGAIMADTAFKSGTPGNTPFIPHTPGPWRTAKSGIFAGHTFLAHVSGGTQIATEAEVDANAHLLAAAPELLASLLALLDANHSGEPVRIARAVWTGLALLARLSNSAVNSAEIGLNAEPEPSPDNTQFKRQAPARAVGAVVLAMGGVA